MSDFANLSAVQARAAAAVGCQSTTLPSGLTVLCRTMPGYSSVHAIYATSFGSIHRSFTLDGKEVVLPAGTAHFLEHKMCETPKGDSFRPVLRPMPSPATTAPAICSRLPRRSTKTSTFC